MSVRNRFASVARPAMRYLALGKNVHVGPNFHVGRGSVLWAPRRLQVGRDVYIGKHVTIEADGRIGDGVLIANLVGIVGRTDHDIHDVGSAIRNARWVGDHPDNLSRQTFVGADVWIGYGAIIMSGVSIGQSAVIGSGSVVTHDVPANAVVVGNPARIVGQRFDGDLLYDHWRRLRDAGYDVELPGQTA